MICHEYKCVFVHIPKCAGQSIAHVFLDLLGLTWETRASLLMRIKEPSESGPPRLAHLKAHEYALYNYIPQDQFNSYFKFAFVRNPWDRMVSIYKYFHYNEIYSFKYFLKNNIQQKLWKDKFWFVGPQNEFVYNDEGKLLVDFIGKFENLQQDFNIACRKIGLPDIPLKHVNESAPRENKKPGLVPKQILQNWRRKLLKDRIQSFQNFREYYDKETKQFVAELYKRDIELFGYSFESA